MNNGVFYPYKSWVRLSDCPKYLTWAVVLGEDPIFFSHCGVCFKQIPQLLKYNREHKKTIGGSSISQQTIKNLFFIPDRSYLRKAVEAYLTLIMEFFLPKERILEIYLNIIEFGRGTFGVKAGAELYFKKWPSDLRLDEICFLVGTMPRPGLLTSFEQAAKDNLVIYRASIIYKKLLVSYMKDHPGKIQNPCFFVL